MDSIVLASAFILNHLENVVCHIKKEKAIMFTERRPCLILAWPLGWGYGQNKLDFTHKEIHSYQSEFPR